MQEPENKPSEPTPAPEKKHNLGAKIGVSLTLGSMIGGKLALPAIALDVNSLFPKDTPWRTKIRQTFSKDILHLADKAWMQQVEKGHHPIVAGIIAMKWWMSISTVVGIGLGVLGWKRADLIQNSSDIYKHPITSAKILLGLQDSETLPAQYAPEIKSNYTSALVAERASQPEAQPQR